MRAWDWEEWIGGDNDVPLLVKVAMGHYQFETLHPFNDGNGRLGRLVATLQLMRAGALRYPLLNLSPWLEARRTEYQDELLSLSQHGRPTIGCRSSATACGRKPETQWIESSGSLSCERR